MNIKCKWHKANFCPPHSMLPTDIKLLILLLVHVFTCSGNIRQNNFCAPFLSLLTQMYMFRTFRCFSSYAVGSYVAYGEPLASCKHSSDKDSDSVQEM